ncbi:MAG: hypothetical protein ACRCS3_12920 [Paracoccaceae bacterium]
MPAFPRAADAAKRLLRSASHQLMTQDPTADRAVTQALDQSLDWTVADPSLRAGTGRSFEPAFSETAGRSLAFQVQPAGRGVTLQDQYDISNGAARALIHEHFGANPLNWFDAKSEPARALYSQTKGYGARYALGLDRNGLTEVQASYEWGPSVLDMLPDPVLDLAQTAMSALPGLQPFATTIRCGRMSGGQQISFEVTQDTNLDAFLPLMQALGMAERHGGFVTLLAFVMGTQFTLPARVATLTLLQTLKGPELRLDVNIDALPDAPEQLLPLLRLPMTERPQNLAALDAWMTAMTPDGYYGPGSVTVLSVRVRADLPARLALYLRPLAMDPAQAAAPIPTPTFTTPQSAHARARF